MFGTLSEEAEVNVPASKAWDLFGTLKLAKLVDGKIFEAVDVIEGDGGAGTILKLTFKSGTSHHIISYHIYKMIYINSGGTRRKIQGYPNFFFYLCSSMRIQRPLRGLVRLKNGPLDFSFT
ncbi:putative START-like domain superfamily protein [Helianthus debilis subsp. tardiflorus]